MNPKELKHIAAEFMLMNLIPDLIELSARELKVKYHKKGLFKFKLKQDLTEIINISERIVRRHSKKLTEVSAIQYGEASDVIYDTILQLVDVINFPKELVILSICDKLLMSLAKRIDNYVRDRGHYYRLHPDVEELHNLVNSFIRIYGDKEFFKNLSPDVTILNNQLIEIFQDNLESI